MFATALSPSPLFELGGIRQKLKLCSTQRKLIGEDHLVDIEPTQYGMALFARPDVFEAVFALAGMPASFVTIVDTRPLDE